MAGPRAESSDADGGCCGFGDGRSFNFAGEIGFGGEERLGGEELGVISLNGAEPDGGIKELEESLSAQEAGGNGVSSSKCMADDSLSFLSLPLPLSGTGCDAALDESFNLSSGLVFLWACAFVSVCSPLSCFTSIKVSFF